MDRVREEVSYRDIQHVKKLFIGLNFATRSDKGLVCLVDDAWLIISARDLEKFT